MINSRKFRLSRQIVIILLGLVTVLYLISGFGITQFRIVESLTFGLFTKVVAFQIHDFLWIPFLILLAVHITLGIIRIRQEK